MYKKQTVIYSYKGILLSNKKEQATDTTTWMNLRNIMLSEKDLHKLYAAGFHSHEVLE